MEIELASYKFKIFQFAGCLPVTECVLSNTVSKAARLPALARRHENYRLWSKNGPCSDAISDEDIDDIEKLRVP